MSSSSIDEIPPVIREIFDNPKPEDWIVVYYLTDDRKVLAKANFLFEGRERKYQKEVVGLVDGQFHEAFIVYEGRTARHYPNKDYSLQLVSAGQHFFMTFEGELIP